MMTIKQEKELEKKGYRIKVGFMGYGEARAYAEDLRSIGYYARVGEYSTAIRGLHDYAVWYKKKEV